jgi:UDP-hydrolysing UDP-N-acetyl-D-glucosamine 2-epimerase
MHCSETFGNTAQLVEEAGFKGYERLAWITDEVLPSAAEQAGAALRMVGRVLGKRESQALIILGDRFETAAAALAATIASIPIIHISGGEETEGAFDNQLRHAITKMSHLHFVGSEDAAARLWAMGEDPNNTHVVGDPLLDNLHRKDLASREELEEFIGGSLQAPVIIVTIHPTTLGDSAESECHALIEAIGRVEGTYIITQANSDPGHEIIRGLLLNAAQGPRRYFVPSLGDRRYWGLMRCADAMLGNSSSGIVEAPAVELPVVNIGDRQKGRLRASNVIDVPPDCERIADALHTALTSDFRVALRGSASPYGDGHSAERIVKILMDWFPPHPPKKSSVHISYGGL